MALRTRLRRCLELESIEFPNKHLKNTKLYSIEFLRTEMTSDLSNRNGEYEPFFALGSYEVGLSLRTKMGTLEAG